MNVQALTTSAKTIHHKVSHRLGKPMHHMETLTHLSYCTVLFFEEHGVIGMTAGVMGVVILLATILGEEK